MDVVVERGEARCPRCVAIAEYSFIECAPGLIRYEVECGRCGERYREQNSCGATKFSTDIVPRAYPEYQERAGSDGVGRLVADARQRWSTVVARVREVEWSRLSKPRERL